MDDSDLPIPSGSRPGIDGKDLPIPNESCMVIVLGETGSGKSFFIRKLTSNPQVRVSHNLESCTQVAEAFEAQIGRTSILLIDTPGFDDSIRSDAEIILEIASSLAAQSAMGVRLLGIIYMHDITVSRMRGSLKRELEMLRLIVGPRNYRHILLVTTKWSDISRRREYESRQFELEDNYWDDLMQGGAEVHRFEGTSESAQAIISQLNFGSRARLALQEELARNIKFRETAIGRYTERVRHEKQSELQSLCTKMGVAANLGPSTTLTSIPETSVGSSRATRMYRLEAFLQNSASDTRTMDVQLNLQVKQWIREMVIEEQNRNKRRLTVAKAMASVLTRMAAFLNRFDGSENQTAESRRHTMT